MTDLQRLLPPSISPDAGIQAAARAAGQQEAAVRGLIPRVYLWSRLEELPPEVLEHLGWALHLDGWEYAATRRAKLWLIRHQYLWHAHKGTAYGLALYWRVLLGRRLLKAAPPGKSYLGSSLTPQERAAFEAPHPELRLYPFRHQGSKQSLFLGDTLGDPEQGWAVFPARTDALLRIGTRVELYDPLLEAGRPLHELLYRREQARRLARGEVEVRKPGRAAGQFLARPLAWPTVDHGAAARLFRLQMVRPWRDELERRIPLAVQPSLRPVRVYYRVVARPGRAGRLTFLANRWPEPWPERGGRAWLGAAWPAAGDAGLRLYRCFKLYDPQRVSPSPRRASLFLGAFRLGSLPPHTAEVALDLAGRRPPRGLHLPGHAGGGCLYVSAAAARVAQARQVGRLAARVSDRILLSIHNRRPVRASAGLKVGRVVAGEYRLEVI